MVAYRSAEIAVNLVVRQESDSVETFTPTMESGRDPDFGGLRRRAGGPLGLAVAPLTGDELQEFHMAGRSADHLVLGNDFMRWLSMTDDTGRAGFQFGSCTGLALRTRSCLAPRGVSPACRAGRYSC